MRCIIGCRETIHNLLPSPTKTRRPEPGLRALYGARYETSHPNRAAYRGQELAEWRKAQGNWDLQVVEQTVGIRDFQVQPKRWVVERTFELLSRSRRMGKDYERKVQTSETLI